MRAFWRAGEGDADAGGEVELASGCQLHRLTDELGDTVGDLDGLLLGLDVLFIENVGNLVCTSSYDLGEQLRLVLMSVTEGEDKPLKYPTIFNTADVCVITKMDLANAVEFDLHAARENIQSVRPGMQTIELSVKSGEGMESYFALLLGHKKAQKTQTISV